MVSISWFFLNFLNFLVVFASLEPLVEDVSSAEVDGHEDADHGEDLRIDMARPTRTAVARSFACFIRPRWCRMTS